MLYNLSWKCSPFLSARLTTVPIKADLQIHFTQLAWKQQNYAQRRASGEEEGTGGMAA